MLRTLLSTAALSCVVNAANAQDLAPMTFQMSWKAQAEQGGYWEAEAKGYYKACGIDMTVRSGGPGIDTRQLLVGGAVDAILVSQNDAVMRMSEAGFPAKAVMAAYQKFPTILLYHEEAGIEEPGDMKGKPVMISQPNRNTFWPFLTETFGLSDDQLRTYSGQLAVWMQDTSAIQQGVVTNEPFRIKEQTGAEPSYFLLADYGYNPYTSLVVVSQKMIDDKPQLVKCLVDASRKGWDDFMQDPAVGFKAVQAANAENTDALMAYSYGKMKDLDLVENADTKAAGFGAMTDARWQSHFETLVSQGLFKPDFDLKSAYTLQFLD